MVNANQKTEIRTLKQLIKILPNRYGYALKVKEALADRGIDVTKEMIYQTVFGNTRHADITREVITLVRDYKRALKEMNQVIDEIMAD